MPVGRVPRRRRQEIHVALNLARNLLARERCDPGGGQLQPQRKPLDKPADLLHRLAILRGRRKADARLPRTLQKQPGRAARLQDIGSRAFWYGQSLHAKNPLDLQTQRLA